MPTAASPDSPRLASALLALALFLSSCASSAPATPPGVLQGQPGASLAAIASPPASTLPPLASTENAPTPLAETPTRAAAPTTIPPRAPAAPAATAFPDPASFTWQTVTGGLTRPLAVSGDRQGRLLVVEQPGRIRVVEAGSLRAEPFLDISAQVGSRGNEQGLLGLALHPDYAQNGLFYVNYTDLKGSTVIARFSADPQKASAAPESEQVLLRVKQPFANHNGGSMAFGPDGFLYLGLGDGGSGGDPQGNGQKTDTLLGKLLRLDINRGDSYAIPADNPFAGGGGQAEIWAYGLRNPWRFSFDRASGDLYIGDVGQDTWEEIDYLPAGSPGGANFGWNLREGANPYKGTPPTDQVLVEPVFQYKHPTGCSVSGGFVYRGSDLPEFQGIYLFGDYCNGRIWGLLRGPDGSWQNQLLFQSGAFLSSFGEDDRGELYITDNNAGVVLQLVRKP